MNLVTLFSEFIESLVKKMELSLQMPRHQCTKEETDILQMLVHFQKTNQIRQFLHEFHHCIDITHPIHNINNNKEINNLLRDFDIPIDRSPYTL